MLFVYGTLSDPEVLALLMGRAPERVSIAAALAPGFRIAGEPGSPYPALVPAPGAAATGLLLLGLSRLDGALLDAYAADGYRRGIVPVLVDEELHEAESYLPAAAIGADAPAWSLAAWQATHKAAVLAALAEEVVGVRQALIAALPN